MTENLQNLVAWLKRQASDEIEYRKSPARAEQWSGAAAEIEELQKRAEKAEALYREAVEQVVKNADALTKFQAKSITWAMETTALEIRARELEAELDATTKRLIADAVQNLDAARKAETALTEARAEAKRHREQICAERQHTICARCGEDRHTPLRRDHMGGYVCVTCIDHELDAKLDLQAELAEARKALTRESTLTDAASSLLPADHDWHNMRTGCRIVHGAAIDAARKEVQS